MASKDQGNRQAKTNKPKLSAKEKKKKKVAKSIAKQAK